MSKRRTLKEYLSGPSTREAHRGYGKPQIVSVEEKAQEDLTQLGELEDAAKAEQEQADQDSAEAAEGNPLGSIDGESPPMSFSSGTID